MDLNGVVSLPAVRMNLANIGQFALAVLCADARLDLLTLSHFHNDHINGVVDLPKAVGAATVMLPWAPLWHRLPIGFDQGLQAGDAEMLFFVDPVAYLTQEAGEGFERIPLRFAAIGDTCRTALLNGTTAERQDAVRLLRSQVETIFGRAAMNDVSVMLYGGAVGLWRGQRFCNWDCPGHRLFGFCGCWKEDETKGAILLTAWSS